MFNLLVAILLLRDAAASAYDQHQMKDGHSSAFKSQIRAIMSELTSEVNTSTNRTIYSKSSSTIALGEDLLEGYLNLAAFTDTSCTALSYAEIIPLNNCYTFASTYYMFTATSTAYSASSYNDAKCQTITKTVGPYIYSSTCTSSAKKFISTTTQISSTTPVVFQNFYPVSDASCSLVPYDIQAYGLNICTANQHMAKVSGSTIYILSYSAPKCDGYTSVFETKNGHCSTFATYSTMVTSSVAASTDSYGLMKSCFAGSETVTMESGETKAISEVRAGDRVLAADSLRRTLYSDVVFVPHAENKEKAVFTHISTTQGRDIKMTPSHIIPAGACVSTTPLPDIYASSVTVGDCIMTVSGMEEVSAVETVQGQGLYTIVTKEEYVVVNGIIASPFAYNHMLANLYYNINRFVYACVPGLLTFPFVRPANEALELLIPLTRLMTEAPSARP